MLEATRGTTFRFATLVLLALSAKAPSALAETAVADYFTLPPCRIYDTRTPVHDPLHGGPNGRRDIQISGVCGVPADATVVAVNLTAVNITRSGSLAIYDADLASAPTPSTVELSAGRNRANNALVELSATGRIAAELSADFAADETAELVVDVLGYFASAPPTAVDDTAIVAQDSADNPIDVLANDTDPDGGKKLVTAVDTTGTFGSVAITGGGTGIAYTPPPGYCITVDTFSYTINGGSMAQVTVSVPCTAIRLVKSTNGNDANSPPGPSIPQGNPVQWTYRVTNIGGVALTNVKVVDTQGVTVSCPKTTLQPGESINCFGNGLAQACQYKNFGIATAKTPTSATIASVDLSHYFGTPCP